MKAGNVAGLSAGHCFGERGTYVFNAPEERLRVALGGDEAHTCPEFASLFIQGIDHHCAHASMISNAYCPDQSIFQET